MKKLNLSSIFLVFTIVLFGILIFLGNVTTNLSWDIFGYYLYLPSKFIYNDLALQSKEWLDSLILQYEPTATLYQATKIENGKWVMKYTMGLAVLYAPFFFIGHLFAILLDFPADGLSAPYQVSITFGSWIFMAIGLIYFRKLLLNYFSEQVTIVLLVLVIFGTNYFQQSLGGGSLLSHHFLFTLMAMMLYHLDKWHKTERLKDLLIVSVSIGLSALIRPTEMLLVIIPVLWGIHSRESLKTKLRLIGRNKFQLAAGIISGILIVLPQLFYWKSVSGKYLFNSYVNPGEGLDLLSPYTFQYLFSFRKGWFIYTPLVVVALAGFIYLKKKKPELFPAFVFYTVVNLYIVSSWSCWWYAGGSFSARSMVPWYVIMAFPLGYLITSVHKKTRNILAVVFGLFIILNLFQTWQFTTGVITRETMTAKYYFSVFGKTEVPSGAEKYLLVDRGVNENESLPKDLSPFVKKELGIFSFEEEMYRCDTTYTGSGALRMNESVPFSPEVNISYKELTDQEYVWIHARCRMFIPSDYTGPDPRIVASFHYEGKAYKYRSTEMNMDTVKRDRWISADLYYITPEVRSVNDNLKVYVWHRGKGDILVDDFWVEFYEPIPEESFSARKFEKFTFDEHPADSSGLHKGEFELSSKTPFTPGIDTMVKHLGVRDNSILRTKARIFIPDDFKGLSPNLVTTLQHEKETYGYRNVQLYGDQVIRGGWQTISMDYRLPDIKSPEDILKIYLWYEGEQPVRADDLEIEIISPK